MQRNSSKKNQSEKRPGADPLAEISPKRSKTIKEDTGTRLSDAESVQVAGARSAVRLRQATVRGHDIADAAALAGETGVSTPVTPTAAPGSAWDAGISTRVVRWNALTVVEHLASWAVVVIATGSAAVSRNARTVVVSRTGWARALSQTTVLGLNLAVRAGSVAAAVVRDTLSTVINSSHWASGSAHALAIYKGGAGRAGRLTGHGRVVVIFLSAAAHQNQRSNNTQPAQTKKVAHDAQGLSNQNFYLKRSTNRIAPVIPGIYNALSHIVKLFVHESDNPRSTRRTISETERFRILKRPAFCYE